jgi:uncharacterized protein (DUF427 family)
MNKLEEGEEPAVKETIYLKGKADEKPKLRPANTIKTEPTVTKNILSEVKVVRARDTIYPTIQEPVKSASAVDSSKLLGWEKDTKLLEKPSSVTFPINETVKTNPVVKSETVIAKTETIVVAQNQTPTVYPASIDYNKLPKTTSGLHTVVKGDTMYNICKRYNISVAQLTEWNNLSDQNVKLGQVLKIRQ